MVLKRQGVQKLVLSFAIMHYETFHHINKKLTGYHKVMCGCECCIFFKSFHFSLLLWRYFCLYNLKYKIQSDHNRRSGELASCDNYKNDALLYGRHNHKAEA